MKTRIGVIVIAALLAAGCENGGELEAADRSITPAEMEALVDPVPGAAIEDYRARERTLRVLGVQGDPPFATVADTTTWQTWNLHAGETIGRGLRVREVSGALLLEDGAGSTVSVPRDAAVPVRAITHRLDEAAVYEGRATWRIEPDALREIAELHGAGAVAEPRPDLFPVPAVELVQVDEPGVLGHLGFRAGDFVLELDGAPIPSDVEEAIVTRATAGGGFTVRIYRSGAPGLRTFRID